MKRKKKKIDRVVLPTWKYLDSWKSDTFQSYDEKKKSKVLDV